MTEQSTLSRIPGPVVALGAGIASAILFVVAQKGTMLSMALAYLTPLPLMIAGLGFGVSSGLLAVISGSFALAIIALSRHPCRGPPLTSLRRSAS